MAPNITRHRICVTAAFITCLLVSSVCAAENTSTLVMLNGNMITGWVKGLDQGKLSFGTDDLGTLSVNWDRVATITSSEDRPRPYGGWHPIHRCDGGAARAQAGGAADGLGPRDAGDGPDLRDPPGQGDVLGWAEGLFQRRRQLHEVQ